MDARPHTPDETPAHNDSVRNLNYRGRVIQMHAVDFNQQFRDVLNPKDPLYGETE